jgi:hypothetical protein
VRRRWSFTQDVGVTGMGGIGVPEGVVFGQPDTRTERPELHVRRDWPVLALDHNSKPAGYQPTFTLLPEPSTRVTRPVLVQHAGSPGSGCFGVR